MEVEGSIARTDVESEDWELASRASQGDRSAYEDLYRKHFEAVFRSCFQITNNTNDALDATQEAFCKVFEKLHKLNGPSENFAGYLFRTSRNVSLKMVLKRKRAIAQAEVEPHGEEGTMSYDDPERSLLIDDQRRTVHKSFRRLSGRQSTAISMCDVEGMSYRQISEAMGIKENAVAQLILRARARLRQEVRFRAAPPAREFTCREVMSELAKGDRALEGQRLLRAHLNGCDNCQASLQDMQEAGVTYRAEIVPILAAAALERAFSESAVAAGLGGSIWPHLGQRAYLLISGLSLSAVIVALTVPTGLGLFSGNERERGAGQDGVIQSTSKDDRAYEGGGVFVSHSPLQGDGRARDSAQSVLTRSSEVINRSPAIKVLTLGRRAVGTRRGSIHEGQDYRPGINVIVSKRDEQGEQKQPEAIEKVVPANARVPQPQETLCSSGCLVSKVVPSRDIPLERLMAMKDKQFVPIRQPGPSVSGTQRFTVQKTNSR